VRPGRGAPLRLTHTLVATPPTLRWTQSYIVTGNVRFAMSIASILDEGGGRSAAAIPALYPL
jgi:hypothetical protein